MCGGGGGGGEQLSCKYPSVEVHKKEQTVAYASIQTGRNDLNIQAYVYLMI